MPAPETPDRRLPGRQQEARTNDSAVITAAREVFSARGQDASMAEIARRAGVGVGSIYRRYPTKQALNEALRVHSVREAAVVAREVAASTAAAGSPGREDAPAAGGSVATFLARMITSTPGPTLLPPGGTTPISAELSEASAELGLGLEALITLDRAQRFLPAGFTTADVMQLLIHLRPALPSPDERANSLHLRYLDFAMRGLHEQAKAGVAIDAGPHWDEWLQSWRD